MLLDAVTVLLHTNGALYGNVHLTDASYNSCGQVSHVPSVVYTVKSLTLGDEFTGCNTVNVKQNMLFWCTPDLTHHLLFCGLRTLHFRDCCLVSRL